MMEDVLMGAAYVVVGVIGGMVGWWLADVAYLLRQWWRERMDSL